MGLGSTAKKLQKVTTAAEELYAKMNEVITKIQELETEVQETSRQVDDIEQDLAEQRALVEAVADAQGVDVEEVLDDVEAATKADAESEAQAKGENEADADAEEEQAEPDSTEGRDDADEAPKPTSGDS